MESTTHSCEALVSGAVALIVVHYLMMKLPRSHPFTLMTVAGVSLLLPGWTKSP
jgi:uncharacterized membrane protein HdeD (DUF308 family)